MFQVQPWINRSTEVPNLSDIVNAVSKGEESRLQSTKHTQSQSRRCAKGGKMKKKKCAGERGM